MELEVGVDETVEGLDRANSRGGAIMYIRFGGTTAQLADKYRFESIMDDFSKAP